MKKFSIITLLFFFHLQPYCFNNHLQSKNWKKPGDNECNNLISLLTSKNKESFNTDKLINKVINKYQKKITKNAFITKGHYHERSKLKGEYLMFTEGLGYLVSLGYNYIIPRGNLSFLSTNFKKSDRKKEWISLRKHLYNNTPVTKQTDFQPGYKSLLSCFRRFEIKGPLSKKCELDYRFEKQTKIINGEKTIYKISFSPEKIESAEQRYYEGIFYVDSKTLEIRKIVLQVAPVYSHPFHQWINKAKLKIDYKSYNNKYYISKLESYYKKENIEHWVVFKTLKDKIYNLKLSKKYKKHSEIYNVNPLVKYEEKEWDNCNLTKFKDINKIRKDLENNISIEEQFIKNSGKPFYISKFSGHKKFDKKMEIIYKYMENKIEEYEEKYNFTNEDKK